MSDGQRAATVPVSAATDRKIDALLDYYPKRSSALLGALYAVQEEQGWVSEPAMEYVAAKFSVSPAFVAGVVSFYTMFHRSPLGRHHIQLCRTLSCMLRGSRSVMKHLQARLGVAPGGVTGDGRFSLAWVECLGACDTAPCAQINDDDVGLLDAAKADSLLEKLK
ncbi:MAG TPA: NAD(P)H-dependent oxidoreductase subunit E [Candidatus Polarisedimenticolia bacterium]|nr:NAD(P)H-dependent oxidoreductase subunit E [Candidatus Polarisedimenticolia bacterium]